MALSAARGTSSSTIKPIRGMADDDVQEVHRRPPITPISKQQEDATQHNPSRVTANVAGLQSLQHAADTLRRFARAVDHAVDQPRIHALPQHRRGIRRSPDSLPPHRKFRPRSTCCKPVCRARLWTRCDLVGQAGLNDVEQDRERDTAQSRRPRIRSPGRCRRPLPPAETAAPGTWGC